METETDELEQLINEGQYVKALALVEACSNKTHVSQKFLQGKLNFFLKRYDQSRESLLDALAARTAGKKPVNDSCIAEIYYYLSKVQTVLAQHSQALLSAMMTLDYCQSNHLYWIQLGKALRWTNFTLYDAQFERRVIEALQRENIDALFLANAGYSLLKHHPKHSRVIATFLEKGQAAIEDPEVNNALMALLGDPLFLLLLEKSQVIDREIETFLTLLRRTLLLKGMFLTKIEPFLTAFALTAYRQEYVYAITPEEELVLKAYQQQAINDHKTLSLLCAYAPLRFWTVSETVQKVDKRLIKQQIENQKEERRLESTISRLKPLTDDISIKVQQQYEENPYPRWSQAMLEPPASLQRIIDEELPNNCIEITQENHPKILIAGCGTGRHALHSASRYGGSEVTAIDISRRSLAYAKRKAMELQLQHVNFIQADILDLESMEEYFDVIECVGVLHHMQNPGLGLYRLCQRLKPGGLINIGLYSERGRQDVLAARKLAAALSLDARPSGIRRCRAEIANLPDQSIGKRLAASFDFFSMSSCRDLIFHVHERCFNIPEIEKMLTENSLTFLGFTLSEMGLFYEYLRAYPDDVHGLSLAQWNDFECSHPDAFMGMYQFWCQKKSS